VTVDVTQFTPNSNPIIERRDNLALVPDGFGSWTTPGPTVLKYDGRFDAPPDPSTQASPYIGDHLIGFQTGNAGILLTFNVPIYSVGFRISARSNTQGTVNAVGGGTGNAQDVRVQAFNITNPTNLTVPYLSFQLQDSTGFGQCTGLGNIDSDNPNPQPCNDAPYIGIDSTSSLFTTSPIQALPGNPWISSVYITSTDPNGFYIDQLYLNTQVTSVDTGAPEPATPILIGSGLAAAAMFLKRRRS
jgi:hypothetical protein